MARRKHHTANSNGRTPAPYRYPNENVSMPRRSTGTSFLSESSHKPEELRMGRLLFVLVVLFFPRGLLGFIGTKRES